MLNQTERDLMRKELAELSDLSTDVLRVRVHEALDTIDEMEVETVRLAGQLGQVAGEMYNARRDTMHEIESLEKRVQELEKMLKVWYVEQCGCGKCWLTRAALEAKEVSG